MYRSKTILLILVFIAVASATTMWRRAVQDSASSMPPSDIVECYNNETLSAPDKRMPMNMENLIGIIRKLEQHRDFYSWNAKKMAGMLLWRFRYDGMILPNNLLNYDHVQEWVKMDLISRLIDRVDTFPEDSLTKHEKCALHWMLSYSTGTVYLDKDNIYSQSGSHQVRRSVQEGDHISLGHDRNPHESLPGQGGRRIPEEDVNVFETGAVYTPWGTLTAGTVLSGIAIELDKASVQVRMLLPSDQLKELYSRVAAEDKVFVDAWAATLAGDMGQTAVLTYKKPDYPVVGPPGKWNNRLTPKIYTLKKPGYNAEKIISYLTDSEIRGGIDGLLLSSKIREWNKNNFKLSQLLDMYYSEMGVSVDRSFRACNRYEKFRNDETINSQLNEKAVQFAKAYALTTHTYAFWKPEEDDTVMSAIKRDLDSHISGMEKKQCEMQPDPAKPISETYTDLYMVLDSSAYETDWYTQTNLTAALGITMDIFGNGSHIEVINGYDGEPYIRLYATGNGAELGYIMQQRRWSHQEIRPDFVLNKLRQQFLDLREYEERKRLSGSNTQVIMFVMFSKIKPEDKEDFKEQVNKLRRDVPDVKLIFATQVSKNEFQEFVEESSKNDDVISLSSFHSGKETNQELVASGAMQAAAAINKRFQEIPARLFYPHCYTLTNSYTDEGGFKHVGLVTPKAVQYFSYGPEQFFTSEDLRIKVKANYGGLKVCWSRDKLSLSDKQQSESCKELKPSGSEDEVEVTYGYPCGEDGTHWGCRPIYFSFEGLDQGLASSSYCQDEANIPCKYPNSVKFTISHSGMTCNGALSVLGSPSLILLTAALLYLYFSRD